MQRHVCTHQPMVLKDTPVHDLLKEPVEVVRVAVVIAGNETLLPIQPRHDRGQPGTVTHDDVTQMVPVVARLHARIVIRNKGLVHLFGGREGAVTVLDDVRVPEVGIAREPDVCHAILQ